MSNFKPQLSVVTEDSIRNYRNDYSGKVKGETLHIRYKTYRELKKDIKKYLLESVNNKVMVSRSKRGEWGEWAETWSMIIGKPTIVKQTWL